MKRFLIALCAGLLVTGCSKKAAAPPPNPLATMDQNDPEVRAATWILKVNGQMIMHGSTSETPIFRADKIPAAGFHIRVVKLDGVSMSVNDKDINQGLANLVGLTQCEELLMDRSKVNSEGLAHVKEIKSLKRLDLTGCEDLTDKDLELLKDLPNLETISLAFTRIGDAGIKTLSEIKSLKDVAIPSTRVTAAAVEYLKQLPNLERLSAAQTGIKAAQAQELIDALHLDPEKVSWKGGTASTGPVGFPGGGAGGGGGGFGERIGGQGSSGAGQDATPKKKTK